MKNALVVWQHKEMCVASNTSGRFAYAHLNDTVRQDSAVVVRLGSSWWGMVLVRRSRLGSFRKDSIWRSWVRSGGQGRAAFGGAWRVQVGQGGLGSARSGMIRSGPVWYHKARRSRLGVTRKGQARYGSVVPVKAVQARHGAVCCGAMRSGSARPQPTVRGHADPSPL